MIKVQALQHSYENGQKLDFPDWEIQQGEHWLMLGNSGSGKTTLLHILTGLLKPSRGGVHINDTELYGLSGSRLDLFRGRHIGLIFQRPHLIRSLTIMENMMLAQSLAGLKTDRDLIGQLLRTLNIFEKQKSYPAELSQGQLQRVSIARAVINKPALIMADEPTSSLDDVNTATVLDLLTSLATENGATLIIATHDKRVKERIQKSYLVKL
ncbi:ABC transporter ATP-binding protein [Mucilaginibacter sp. UYCu711]|uniref:ABC transporter ATP-binding protein n=1 Tax=Mucilaginibacter sp. UYCu711 TaxID=3156339 RepID=UPI003D1D0E06